jgi:hypothetical protein
MVVHTCDPSYLGGKDRRIEVQSQPRQKCETLSEKLKAKEWQGIWLKWYSTCLASVGPQV